MRYKTIGLLGLVLAGLLYSGCITMSKLSQLDNLPPNETIAVARFHIKYKGQDVTPGCNIIFSPMLQNILDESGYAFMHLPIGTNHIKTLIHRSGLMHHNFRPGELSCQLSGGGAINYIGDITLDWNGGAGVAGNIGLIAATGVIGQAFLSPQGTLVVSVESKPAEAQEAFRRKFSTDRSITPSLLVVKPRK